MDNITKYQLYDSLENEETWRNKTKVTWLDAYGEIPLFERIRLHMIYSSIRQFFAWSNLYNAAGFTVEANSYSYID